MLVVRGTKKLRDRVKVRSSDEVASTTALGDWFATALFWRPHVALLVNTRTFIPVFMELAPAATLLDRVPGAIETVLRHHGVDESFLAAETVQMADVAIASTNDRRVLGVMNEFVFLAEHHQSIEPVDLIALSLRLAHTPVGPLQKSTGSPDLELASVVAAGVSPAVVPVGSEPLKDPGPAVGPSGDVYQLKVTLLGVQPAVWRRVLVDGASALDHVHEVIQAAFGWWNYHLHEFDIDGVLYGRPDPDFDPEFDWGPPTSDEREVRLDSLVIEGDSFRYVYDFGDGWKHKITVEKVIPAPDDVTVPACVTGRRACPPEDCGGPSGYEALLKALADPSHHEHDAQREWIGRPFDPNAFEPGDFEENLQMLHLSSFDE